MKCQIVVFKLNLFFVDKNYQPNVTCPFTVTGRI